QRPSTLATYASLVQRPSGAGATSVVGHRPPTGTAGSKRLAAVASTPTSASAPTRRLARSTMYAVTTSAARRLRVPPRSCASAPGRPVTADSRPTVVRPPTVPTSLAAP